jgi:PAS domain S-box-containing protein
LGNKQSKQKTENVKMQLPYVALTSLGKGQPTGANNALPDNILKLNFEALLNFVSDAILIIDGEGVIRAANNASCKILEISKEQLIGNHLEDLKIIDEKTKLLIRKQLKKRLNGQDIDNYEIPVLVDHKIKYLEPKGNKIEYFGKPADLIILHDVTDRRKSQSQLLGKIAKLDENCLESESKYLKLFQESADAIIIADAETGLITDCNAAALSLIDCDQSDVIGQHYSSLHTQTLMEPVLTKESGKNLENKPIEAKIVTKKGVQKFVSFKVSSFEFKGRKYVQGTFRDITERKLMQQALQENEKLYREIANSVRDAIILVNDEARVTFWNPSAEKIFGYSSLEATGKNIHEIVVPDSMCLDGRARIDAGVKTFAEIGMGYFTVGNIELVGRRKDGTEFPAKLSISPLKLGEKWSAVGVVKDITERKIAEQKLKDAEQRYHALFNHAPLGVVVVNSETASFVEFNDIAHTQLGYSREEFEKLTIHDIDANQSPDEVRSNIKKILSDGGIEFHTQHRTKTGERRDVLVTVRVFQSLGKKYLHCIFHDITEIRKTQDALVKSESQYRQLVELAQEGIWALDNNFKTYFANPRMSEILGYTETEMLGKHAFDFLTNTDIENLKRYLVTSDNNLAGQYECELIHKNGTAIYTNIAISPIINDQGIKIGVLAVIADITNRKNIEKALKKSEELSRSIVANAPIGIATSDANYKFVSANDEFCRILGYTEEELKKLTFKELTYPEDLQASIEKMLALKNGKINVLNEEKRYIKKNGAIIVGRVTVSAIADQCGQPILFVVQLEDITERKQLEHNLRSSEEKFRAISTSAMDAILLIDGEDRIIYWNPAAERVFGFAEKEVIGQQISTLVIPQFARKRHHALLKKLTNNKLSMKKNFTVTARRKNGSHFPIDLSVSSVTLQDKECMLAIVRDISQQKQLEISLKQERDMLEDITKNIGAGLVIIDKDYRIIWINNYLKRINGDVVSKYCYSTFNTSNTTCTGCGPKKIFNGAEYDSREYFNKELYEKGLPCWFELIATPIKDKDGKVVAALELTVDITEKKELEKKIREERNKLEAITENISAGLMLVNKEYKIVWSNNFAQKWYRQTEDNKCFSVLHCKNTICENCGVQKIFDGKSVDVCTSSIDINGETKILEITTTPMKDNEGNVVAALELAMDITEVKKMQSQLSKYSQQLEEIVKKRTEQLEQAQAKLVKSERLAAIGELAGMVGHDLRNPLTGIKNSAYLLKKKGREISEAQNQEMLDIIDNCVNYSNKIVNDLLDYSREIHLEIQELPVEKLLTQAIAMLTIPKNVDIQVNIPNQQRIEVDPGKIDRVFINLIKNAMDAMQNVGKISIDSKKVDSVLEISFADTGMGISDEILPKLFSPLVTTKAQGMGFGLAICKRIVEAHGGTIKVKTAIGKGTTFTVSLPIKQPNRVRVGGDM